MFPDVRVNFADFLFFPYLITDLAKFLLVARLSARTRLISFVVQFSQLTLKATDFII